MKRTEPTQHLYAGHVYVPAARTDIRLTFARFTQPKPAAKVQPIQRRKA